MVFIIKPRDLLDSNRLGDASIKNLVPNDQSKLMANLEKLSLAILSKDKEIQELKKTKSATDEDKFQDRLMYNFNWNLNK